jgi:imidazolonepropionase-like amidohydrolase
VSGAISHWTLKSIASLAMTGWLAMLTASSIASPASGEAPLGANSFAVSQARVFDGARTIPNATVIVRDGIIEAVAPDAKAPPGLAVIDGRGMTLLPGLIDGHVHVFPGAQADALRFGVTTVLDMYHLGGAEAAEEFRAHRESLAKTHQADTWSAMAGITPPGGHPSQMAAEWGIDILTLAPDADTEAFVQARIAEGADYIKIMQDDTILGESRLRKFSREQLLEIIDAVHAEQRKAIVHVSAHNEAAVAIESGADMIAHVFQDQPADTQLVRLAREQNAAVITTLSVLARAAGSDHVNRLVEHPRLRDYLSPVQQQTLAAEFGRPRPEILEHALTSVGRFHAAGVAVIAGTDAPNPGTGHGVSIHQELELLVEAGLSPSAAINAATALPAERFGLPDRGRIGPGMRADLVLVEGDPTTDITRTRQIVRVWKNGYEVDRRAQPSHGLAN